jgi:cell division protein FtsZ
MESEDYKLPELTFAENESSMSPDSELIPDVAALNEETLSSEDSVQTNEGEMLIDANDLEPSMSYIGLSEPGTPSPEAMARLRAAVEKVPLETKLNDSVEPSVAEVAEKPRFGFNSLISRMTGQHESVDRSEVSAPSTVIDQEFEAEKGANERIDIPAFLRRQAN